MDYLILQEPLLHSVASPGPSYVDLALSFPVRPAHKKTNYYSFATILHFNFVWGGFEEQLTPPQILANNRDIEVHKVIWNS